jgi:DNA-directed RNA polymerase subunit RPC12/RpoP
MCSKRTYPDKAEARRVAKRANTTMGGRAMEAYRCWACGEWHVGHSNPPKARSTRPDDVVPCRYCGVPVTLTQWPGQHARIPILDGQPHLHDDHDPRLRRTA